MPFQRISTEIEGSGISQLKVAVNKPQPGDWVQIHYNGKCNGKFFVDTWRIQKKVQFQVVDDYHRKEGLYRGLNRAVQKMMLGEKSTFKIPPSCAFGEEGLSKANENSNKKDHKNRNPHGVSYLRIGPNKHVELEILLVSIARDDKWHLMQIPEESCAKFLCDMFCGPWSST